MFKNNSTNRNFSALDSKSFEKPFLKKIYLRILRVRMDPSAIQIEKMKLQQALEFVKKGNLSGAKEALVLYLSENPEDPIGNYHLAMCHSHLNELEPAEERFIKAISLDDSFVSARVGLGVLYAKKKDKPKAEIQFTKALEIDENNVNAKKNLASLYTGTGNFKKALDLYLSTPESDRKDVVSLYAISFCYLKSDQLAQARTFFRELEKLSIPEPMKKDISELKNLIEEKNIESEGIWTLLKKLDSSGESTHNG